MQVAIYGGMPAAVDSFPIARELFAELDKSVMTFLRIVISLYRFV